MAGDFVRPVVVLDTNAFHADVEAQRGMLTSVFDGAGNGDYDLVIPAVVVEELVKQYPKRVKSVGKAIRRAVNDQRDELMQLGLPLPEDFTPTGTADAYRARLTARIGNAAGRVAPAPDDLSKALTWAIHRRKPFKESGDGMPDAAIWLTVVKLAQDVAPQRVLLVTANTSDFGDGGTPVALAKELREDLEAFGIPRQVELVPGIKQFADLHAQPLAAADNRATRLLGTTATADRLTRAVEEQLLYRELDAKSLMLGIPVEDDPLIVAIDAPQIVLVEASAIGDKLRLEVLVELEASFEVYVEKSVVYTDLNETKLTVTNDDFSEHSAEVSGTVALQAAASILTNLDATSVEVSIDSIVPAEIETVRRALDSIPSHDLVDYVNDADRPDGGLAIDDYLPDGPYQSEIDEIALELIRGAAISAVEIEERLSDTTYAIAMVVDTEADVAWHASVVAAEDLPSDGSDAEGEPPILFDVETYTPVVMRVVATLAVEPPFATLADVHIESAHLRAREAEERSKCRHEASYEHQEFLRLAEAAAEAAPED